MKKNKTYCMAIFLIICTIISQCFTFFVVCTPFFVKELEIKLLILILIGFFIPAIQIEMAKKIKNSKNLSKIFAILFTIVFLLVIILYDYFIILYSALSE